MKIASKTTFLRSYKGHNIYKGKRLCKQDSANVYFDQISYMEIYPLPDILPSPGVILICAECEEQARKIFIYAHLK